MFIVTTQLFNMFSSTWLLTSIRSINETVKPLYESEISCLRDTFALERRYIFESHWFSLFFLNFDQ